MHDDGIKSSELMSTRRKEKVPAPFFGGQEREKKKEPTAASFIPTIRSTIEGCIRGEGRKGKRMNKAAFERPPIESLNLLPSTRRGKRKKEEAPAR